MEENIVSESASEYEAVRRMTVHQALQISGEFNTFIAFAYVLTVYNNSFYIESKEITYLGKIQ